MEGWTEGKKEEGKKEGSQREPLPLSGMDVRKKGQREGRMEESIEGREERRKEAFTSENETRRKEWRNVNCNK